MKKLLMVVLAVFLTVSIAGAAEESNLPDSQRTDQFTIHQQTDKDDQVKALIGADRIPVVDNADLNNPQFVGKRQGAAASIELQKQTTPSVKSPVAPSDPSDPNSPNTVRALPVLEETSATADVFKYDYEDSKGNREMNNGPVGERRHVQNPASASPPSVVPVKPAPAKQVGGGF